MTVVHSRAALAGFLILAGVFSTDLAAQSSVPERPYARVNDYASILTAAEAASLEARLDSLESKTSTQIFIAIFRQLPADSDTDDFTNRLFEQWRPGLAEQNNGVLLAIFMQERQLRIEVGYGLEDVLTDLRAGRIINEIIVPAFRQEAHYSGLWNAITAMISAVKGKFQIPRRRQQHTRDTFDIAPLIFFILIAIIWLMLARRRAGTTYSSRGYRRHHWGGPGIFGGGGGGFGGGGGGFGGGFGGMSGGGGASGSW